MANVLDLRRRIRSVKNTRQITKAMKMVAAAKLRRAQERALAARPYAAMLASVLDSLKRRIEILNPHTGYLRHPLLETREEKRILVVVVSGDKGFAGGFNANIIKATNQFLARNQKKEIDIEAIGRKGRDHFRRLFTDAQITDAQVSDITETYGDNQVEVPARHRSARIENYGDHPGILHKVEFEPVRGLGEEIVRRYAKAEVDAVYLVYNEFKSVIQQRVVVEKILPIIEFGQQQVADSQELSAEDRTDAAMAAATAGVSVRQGEPDAKAKEFEEEAKKFGTAETDYLYEQSPEEIFNAILPRYITSQLYHGMLESVAAEQAARMTAMDAATNNASEMIDSLTLTMNRVRQAAITKEIIEIVSGASAI